MTEAVAKAPGDVEDYDDHVYKLIELTGTSTESMEAAVNAALTRAHRTIKHLRWFQVSEIRGDIDSRRPRSRNGGGGSRRLLVAGDRDLLDLGNPFGVAIVTSAQFLRSIEPIH